MPPSIAVIGLGAMGLPISQRLAEATAVRAFDISAHRMSLAAASGVETFDTARAAVADVTTVLLIVRDAIQLRESLFGDDGIAGVLSPGSAIVLMSTIGVEAVRAVRSDLEQFGVDLVDAPLSGGPRRAREGDLLIVVGASPAARDKVAPVLAELASTLQTIGDEAGDGQAFKTVNQLLCGIHIAASAEALALARALGLDDRATLDTLTAGAASSFMLSDRGPRMLVGREDDEVLSRLDIFVKDMGIVNRSAQAASVPTPLAAAAEQLYLLGLRQGRGALDDSSVVDVLWPREASALPGRAE